MRNSRSGGSISAEKRAVSKYVGDLLLYYVGFEFRGD